jgi:pimeloyl-ACP methyl ester carboxylesterase
MLKPLTIPVTSELVQIADVQIEVQRRGSGRPVLLLPGEDGLEVESPFLEQLAANHEVTLFWPPGFGLSNRPEWVTMDDVAYLYLDVVKQLGLEGVPVIGCSMGGWIALEMATKSETVFAKMALVDPYGIKVGGPMQRDLADIYAVHPEKIAALKWADPTRGERRLPERSEEELYIIARNIESTARLCWEPYMHNPKLRRRLHRVAVPTLFIWGEQDGMVSVDYGRAYAAGVPGSSLVTIPNAGHLPHIEQTQAFFAALNPFLA